MVSTTSNYSREYIATRIMLGIFTIMGLAPFTFKKSRKWTLSKKKPWQASLIMKCSTSRIGCAYNIILVTLHLCLLTLAIPVAYGQEYARKSGVVTTIELTSCVGGYTMIIIIWLIFGFRQGTIVRLVNRLLSFDDQSLCLGGCQCLPSSRNFFLTVCIANAFMEIGMLGSIHGAFGFLVSSYVMLGIPSIVSAWFITQYAFTVKIAENQLRAINGTLVDCYVPYPTTNSTSEPSYHLRESTVSYRPNIGTLRRAHTNLYEILTEISAFYSPPILFTITYYCFTLIYSGYYFVTPIALRMKELTVLITISSLFRIINRIVPITILTTSVTNVTREIKKTRDVVQRLLTHSNNSRHDNLELKEFLLELLHRKIQFGACGIFSLDCTLLHSIISMVITYLVILVQFQLDNSTKEVHSGSDNVTNVAVNKTAT